MAQTTADGDDFSFAPLADFPELLAKLAAVQDPQGPIACGERWAAAVMAKSSDEIARLDLDPAAGHALREQLQQSLCSLEARAELVRDAIGRLASHHRPEARPAN